MNSRLKKGSLLLLVALLLVGTAQIQRSLNHDRERLGLTHVDPLEDAPPVLAFTTVALGGFRGLIANALWIRMTDLQDEDKYFEMAQLADWITKLEPRFSAVWVHQAWNMAYNISVKFKDFEDRWRWLQAGISLIRDEGLRYNPNDVLMHRELAWFFQNKIGADLDDAGKYYKSAWAVEMTAVFGTNEVHLDELFDPQTDEARARTNRLRSVYKMDPALIQQANTLYGPLEWRLPEAHAIYWAMLGLERAKENPTKVNPDDLIQLRRVIFQSMLVSFQRGHMIRNPYEHTVELAPNLELIPKVNATYEQFMQEEPNSQRYIANAHANFLGNAVYFLYEQNRLADAAIWYRYLGEHYPNKVLLENHPDATPGKLTLQEFALTRVQGDINELSPIRIRAAVEGLLVNAYRSLVLGEDERSAGFQLLARNALASYQAKITSMPGRDAAIRLPSYQDIARQTLDAMLDPERGMPPEMRAVLRAKLNLGAEPAAPPATNAPTLNLKP